MNSYPTNTRVKGQWGQGEGSGNVRRVIHEDVTRTLSGNEITRHGSEVNPAYLIEQVDSSEVLKLHNELSRTS